MHLFSLTISIQTLFDFDIKYFTKLILHGSFNMNLCITYVYSCIHNIYFILIYLLAIFSDYFRLGMGCASGVAVSDAEQENSELSSNSV